jgi:hypothetical protein
MSSRFISQYRGNISVAQAYSNILRLSICILHNKALNYGGSGLSINTRALEMAKIGTTNEMEVI